MPLNFHLFFWPTVYAILIFSLDSPTFRKIIKKKDVESFDPKPYLATVLNCLFWVYYGMPFVNPNSLLVITINGVGLVIELIYLCIFFWYAPPKGRVRMHILHITRTIWKQSSCINSIQLIFNISLNFLVAEESFEILYRWSCFICAGCDCDYVNTGAQDGDQPADEGCRSWCYLRCFQCHHVQLSSLHRERCH